MQGLQNSKVIQVLISAVLAVILIRFYIQSAADKKAAEFAMTEVVASSRDIPARSILQSKDLVAMSVPQQFIQPTAVQVKIPKEDLVKLVGKMTLIPIPEGSQVTEAMLVKPELQDMDRVLEPGKRAYPLLVQRTEVTRLISVGTSVDIIANLSVQDKSGRTSEEAHTVLQNIKVLSVRDEIHYEPRESRQKKDSAEATFLTLAVTPVEAERLSVAEKASQGDLKVVIRSNYDSRTTPIPAVSIQDLPKN